MKKALVISTHLDDAVLSAGQFIAGRPDVVVLTIFAGTPKAKNVATSYDQSTGFKNADDAISVRKTEDQEALALLLATPVHLDFVDDQYGEGSNQDHIAAAIDDQINELEPEMVVGPLGLMHPDHEKVRNAILEIADGHDIDFWLYEDLPYRVLEPETAVAALEAVRDAGFDPKLKFAGDGQLSLKMAALACYRSQLPTLHKFAPLVPERFWRLK